MRTVAAMRLAEHLDHVMLSLATATSVPWSLPSSSAAAASASFRPCRPSRHWSPTSYGAKPISS